jgi:molecular chaperone DnaK
MSVILGIDLGTTNSGAAIWSDGKPQMITDAEGYSLTPSVVALDPENETWVVGREARAIALRKPRAAIYSIKRFIGRRYSDDILKEELQHGRILYELEESRRRRDAIEIALGQRYLTPQEVSAKVLKKLKTDAEAYLGQEISQAVVTVPAYFHDSQRQATRDAGQIAGLNVRRVLNEPTAACLAFGYKKLKEPRRLVAVYDLGGGTFDISLLEAGRGPFRVRATNGDTHLGGDDLDWMILDWILEQIGGTTAKQLHQDIVALAQLRAASEQAKIALSSQETTHITIPGPLGTSDCHDLDVKFTRTELNAIAEGFIAKTLGPCAQALQDARLKASDIEEVILVGGQTRMPAIRNAVREFFDNEVNVSVNPEEVVALGAGVQAAILAGKATGLRLADVVPLSLGVETQRCMNVLIQRNAAVPITVTKSYSTAYDNQESVEINVYQGERRMAADNIKLASFMLKGIEPAPQGEPKIEVTFTVDQDSILHVKAVDVTTGNEKEITITDSVRLNEEEIAAMIKAAEEDFENVEAESCTSQFDVGQKDNASAQPARTTDREVKITVVNQDVATYSCDALVLKHAQGFYGADRTIAERLKEQGIALGDMRPLPNEFRLLPSRGGILASHVLFTGVVPLSNFGYEEIQAFAERALEILKVEIPDAARVAMTIHGVGYGLDEQEAFTAQLKGLWSALQERSIPAGLEQIVIVETDQERASRLQQRLDEIQSSVN